MKDKHKRKLNKRSPVWMTTLHCTGRGKIVHISPKGKTCHVKCGGEVFTGVKSHQVEISK